MLYALIFLHSSVWHASLGEEVKSWYLVATAVEHTFVMIEKTLRHVREGKTPMSSTGRKQQSE